MILTLGLPPASNGGAEIAATQLAKCAAKMGHDMHIVTVGSRPYIEGVQVHQVPTVNVKYAIGLFCIPGVVYNILKIKPDLIHVQSSYMPFGAIVSKLLIGTKVLFYERGAVDMKAKINKYVYPVIMKSADRVIAQTESQKISLLRYARHSNSIKWKDIEVIPNGVDVDKFNNLGKIESRMKLNLPLAGSIVLAVGRCRPEKNMLAFVRAAELVDAKFILVGGGPQLDMLRVLGKKSGVMFTGDIDNSSVSTYMSAADVLVNTSYSEGFPMTILEGMASGLPIVAPKVCGIPEIVTDGVNGLLSEPDNYQSTADMIMCILRQPELAKKMAITNKEKVRQYTWENVVKKLYG